MRDGGGGEKRGESRGKGQGKRGMWEKAGKMEGLENLVEISVHQIQLSPGFQEEGEI